MVMLLGSCTHAPTGPNPLYAQLQAEDPSVRVQAIIAAAQGGDQSCVPLLVDRLSDSDEDVCFYAILALEKLTGTRMGYEYYDPADSRKAAIARWRAWLDAGRPMPVPAKFQTPTTQPASQKTTATEVSESTERRSKNTFAVAFSNIALRFRLQNSAFHIPHSAFPIHADCRLFATGGRA